jgi:hypothetical protein
LQHDAGVARLNVVVIAPFFTPCALAPKRPTASIPIVMVALGDPLGTGLVASLARPGGNITGLECRKRGPGCCQQAASTAINRSQAAERSQRFPAPRSG